MAYKKSPVSIERDVKKSRIKLVGIELEGGWEKIPRGVEYVGDHPPRAGQIGRDGSLDPMRDRLAPTKPDLIIGELPSPPLDEALVETWMRKCWPQVIAPECGMHVHISLKSPLLYMQLMNETYCATVVEYTKKWATAEKFPEADPIWTRLNDRCIYCQHKFFPDAQVQNTKKDYDKQRVGHRYTAINFCYNRETGTIENRMLPMCQDVEQGIRAVKEYISITNRYLLATATREKKHRASSPITTESQIKRLTLHV